MLSSFKDIAVFLDSSSDGERIGRHAAALARRHGAHLVGVYGVARDAPSAADGFAVGEAILEVIERRRAADDQKVAAAARRLADLATEYGITTEFRVVWRGVVGDAAALRALHCDLIVAGHPRPRDLPEDWSAERLLLSSGIPVLLVPGAWSGETIGDKVLIAWNASREARRAIADAMPFVTTAAGVTVAIVDGDRKPEIFGEEPGADLLRQLTNHGAKVEIAHVASQGVRIADVLSSQAAARQADLLVIGAYSRPRATELLFGGTTRHLLANVAVPLLISR